MSIFNNITAKVASFTAIALVAATASFSAQAADSDPADFDRGLGHYLKGEYRNASTWFQAAAKAGDVRAQRNLSVMYYLGQGVKENAVTARMWAEVASRNGNVASTRFASILEGQMSPVETRIATSLADDCTTSSYRYCGSSMLASN
ncbi:MAG: tetratricopeptide repeat protein [Pikeienuella sp.]